MFSNQLSLSLTQSVSQSVLAASQLFSTDWLLNYGIQQTSACGGQHRDLASLKPLSIKEKQPAGKTPEIGSSLGSSQYGYICARGLRENSFCCQYETVVLSWDIFWHGCFISASEVGWRLHFSHRHPCVCLLSNCLKKLEMGLAEIWWTDSH